MDTEPSTLHHSPAVRQFNLEHGAEHIDLSEAGLLTTARKETGLERFGDESFLPAMRQLLASIEQEARLNPFGRFIAKMRTLGSLKNRLWADACFEAYPEIRQRKIAAPIIIIGPHRSGTTRMQRMLATDTRLQYLSSWEGINPAPRLALPDRGRAERYEEVRTMLEERPRLYPGAMAHPMHADWPEEEMLLLNHAFCSFSALGLYYIPGYYRWLLDADLTASYRYMADLMRLISWARNVPEDRPWILKNPQHMMSLGTLLQVFPDARLVFTHRDPLKTVGSMLSLVWFFTVQQTDAPCRDGIREIWLDFCEQLVRRCMQAREHIPASQQLDVHYTEMNRDWRSVMHRVYDLAGLDFTAEAEHGMDAWLAESEREGLHGGHRYALENFGTSAAEVDERMQFYRQHYDIPYE